MREHKLGPDEIPDLLVISDMQFNASLGNPDGTGAGNLVQERIKRMFSALGIELYGHPIDVPQIIIWNVRSSVGYPADAGDKGVMMLSRYSPALMKFVLSGEISEERIVGVDTAGNAVKERNQISTKEAVRKILGDAGLDAVREALNAMPRKIFLCTP